jgi:ribokinase
VLVLQNEVPETVKRAAAETTCAYRASVVLNAAPARAMSQELLDFVDILVVNRIEAEMLVGNSVDGPDRAFDAAKTLQSGRRGVIVTLGSDGLVCYLRCSDLFIIAHQLISSSNCRRVTPSRRIGR